MTVLHTTEVDGVPCWWVDSGRPTLQAHLLLRFGQADESLPESGWQHLVEHLALGGLHDLTGELTGELSADLDVNGSVSLLTTTFDLHGTPAAVAEALGRISVWLSRPTFERLDHEQKVLRVESSWRGTSTAARALSWRYGARGPGVAAFPALGVGRATEDRLRTRVALVAGRGNAALVLDGPPPADLWLDLPDGPRVPIPAARALGGAHGWHLDTELALTGVVPRTAAALLAADLLQTEMQGRLRGELAASYGVQRLYEPVDADHAVAGIVADVDERADEAVAAALQVVSVLAADGPDPTRLARLVERTVRMQQDPYAGIGVAALAARRHLEGTGPTHDLAAMVAETRAVSGAEVQAALRDLAGTLVVGTPVSPRSPALPELRDPLTGPGTPRPGEHFRGIDWPADPSLLVLALDEAPHVVEVHDGEVGRRAPREHLAGYVVVDDGRRTLIRNDGFTLAFDPAWWREGERAVALLDRRVPASLHLPTEAPPATPPQPASIGLRWAGGLSRRTGSFFGDLSRPAFVALFVAMMIGAIGLGSAVAVALDLPSWVVSVPVIAVLAFIQASRNLHRS